MLCKNMQIHSSALMCFCPVAVLTAKIQNYQEHLLKHHKVSQRVEPLHQLTRLDQWFSASFAYKAKMTFYFIWQRTSRTFIYRPSSDLVLFFLLPSC